MSIICLDQTSNTLLPRLGSIVTLGIQEFLQYRWKRNGRDDVFGEPVEVPTSTQDYYLEPEAPTISRDGKLMLFNRIDCVSKSCTDINLYSISRA